MSELIPCPLCGCGHQIDIDEEGGVAFVHQNYNWSKDDCILAIQELDYPEKIDEFVRKWNARPIEDALRAKNEKLKEALSSMYEACMKADEQGELSEYVDGSILDRASEALKEVTK